MGARDLSARLLGIVVSWSVVPQSTPPQRLISAEHEPVIRSALSLPKRATIVHTLFVHM